MQAQLTLGKIPHTYLFSGAEDLGKKMLALEFAKKILKAENLDNHPDFHILDMEGEITVEPVLEFIGRVSLKPFLGQKKVAVINNADNLNIQAANALLKTLEEPSPSSVIILVGASQKILPTIISRCQVLNFSLFGHQNLVGFAEGRGMQLKDKALELSFGRPGRLFKLLTNESFFENQKDVVEKYKKLQSSDLAEKLADLDSLAELEALDLEQNFLTWLFWQYNQLHYSPGNFFKVQALMSAISSLRKNFNKKLVLQALFMKI